MSTAIMSDRVALAFADAVQSVLSRFAPEHSASSYYWGARRDFEGGVNPPFDGRVEVVAHELEKAVENPWGDAEVSDALEGSLRDRMVALSGVTAAEVGEAARILARWPGGAADEHQRRLHLALRARTAR